MPGVPQKALNRWMAVVLYCTVIFIQSSFPSAVRIHDVPFGDKYLHIAGYGLLGVLFFRAFRTRCRANRLIAISLLSIGASVLYGISDEIHQYFVPCRSADIQDVLADLVGSSLGVSACYLMIRHAEILEKYSWIDKLRQFL